MWTRVFLALLLTSVYDCLKFDYEYEELSLFCLFEQMSDELLSSYGCNAKNLNVSSRDTQILEVTGSHKPSSRSDQDVATFYALNPAASYVPKRLGFVFPNLKILMITKSDLKLLEFRDFKNMKKLQKLYLPDNKIEKLPICVFKYAENLEVIDLSGNRITELGEDTFVNLPSLQQFSANDNEIEHLDNALFRNNHGLRKLSMRHNKIASIEINFMKLKEIEVVDLRNNDCINMSFGCCRGPTLRDFQNETFYSCKGPEYL